MDRNVSSIRAFVLVCAFALAPDVVSTGLTLQQMVERFDAVFWSPAPRKLVQEAMLAMDCAHCGKAPVLRKPKYIRWQHILAYGYVCGFVRAGVLIEAVCVHVLQRLSAHPD
jgi:hypothetical protein